MSKKTIEYLEKAKKHLRGIARYTEKKHGPAQREKYLGQIKARIIELKSNSELGRERPEIRAEIRSLMAGKHVIFYRVKEARIQILEVRHESRDLKPQTGKKRGIIRNRSD